jgi:hypothetical protein
MNSLMENKLIKMMQNHDISFLNPPKKVTMGK